MSCFQHPPVWKTLNIFLCHYAKPFNPFIVLYSVTNSGTWIFLFFLHRIELFVKILLLYRVDYYYSLPYIYMPCIPLPYLSTSSLLRLTLSRIHFFIIFVGKNRVLCGCMYVEVEKISHTKKKTYPLRINYFIFKIWIQSSQHVCLYAKMKSYK